MATPPPTTPLPPARARGHTPLKSADPDLTPRATPPGPQNVEGAQRDHARPPCAQPAAGAARGRSSGRSRAARHRPPAVPRPRPGGQAGRRNPMPVVAGPPASAVTTTRPSETGRAPRSQAGHARLRFSAPAAAGLRAGADDAAARRRLARRDGQLDPRFAASIIETARVQFRPQRQWGGVFAVIVLLLAAAGIGVHLWVIPLDVLITWRQPAGLVSRPSRRAPSCASTGSRSLVGADHGHDLARSQESQRSRRRWRATSSRANDPLRQVRRAVLSGAAAEGIRTTCRRPPPTAAPRRPEAPDRRPDRDGRSPGRARRRCAWAGASRFGH